MTAEFSSPELIASLKIGFLKVRLTSALAGVRLASTIREGKRRHGVTKRRRDHVRAIRKHEVKLCFPKK